MTEVWIRNPEYCVKECLEVGMSRIVWDKGYLAPRSLDAKKFMDLYYAGQDYRVLVIDDENTVELRPGSTLDRPFAVYPSWSYGDEISVLEELLESNVADDADNLQDDRVPYGLRPVAGQEHRVVLTNLPPASTGLGRRFFRVIRELQEEYPKAIIHAHGLYGFKTMFGLGYGSVDVEPREIAKKGRVIFPSGKEVTYEKAAEEPQWITLLGFQPHELKVPRNRCMYNIKSAEWAGRHFLENVRFKHKGSVEVDPDRPTAKLATNKVIFTRRSKAEEGDKFLCDTCSLQTSCKYFRTGAICAVPDSEPQPLSYYFQTRDAETIISGLGTLLATQTHRLERGMKNESENDDKLDPEVTKILNGIFDRGVTLAKLLNPALSKPAVQITNNTLNAGSPQQLMAAIVDALEAQGIPRANITPEMIEAVMNNQPELKQKALDVASTERAAS